jgi:hypothetical protein
MQFHLFPRLPAELQELIWEHAVADANTPTVYFANLREGALINPPDRSPCRAFLEQEEGASPLSSLLQTTRHSRSVALKALPAEPVRLHGKHNQNEDHSKRRVLAAPAICIDGTKDLVILQQGWLDMTYKPMLAEQTDLVHYVALPIQDIMSDPRETIVGVTSINYIYRKTRVFYLLFDPETLHAARGPWPQPETRRLLTPVIPIPFNSYRTQYSAGEPHRAFWAGRRQYFDIPPADFAPYGGLKSWISYLWAAELGSANTDREGDVPARFRLMTWRDL